MLAELDAVFVEGMVDVTVAGVSVLAHEMGVVVALEQRMLLHDPANALAHEGPQYSCDHVAVGVGRKGVADVMEQRSRHVLLVLAGPRGARGRLQGVLEPADPERALEPFELGDRVHQPPRQLAGVRLGVGIDQSQVGLGHIRHAGIGNHRHYPVPFAREPGWASLPRPTERSTKVEVCGTTEPSV